MAEDYIRIELEGFEELAAHFEGLADELRQELIATATMAAAKAVETELLSRTPIYLGEYSGTSDALAPGKLLADIAVRPFPDAMPGETVLAVGPGRDTAYVARFVEYGHLMAGHKAQGKKPLIHGKSGTVMVPAHPFLRPAQEASEAAALDAFEHVLREAIEAE